MAQVTQAAERAGAYEAAMQEHASLHAWLKVQSGTAPGYHYDMLHDTVRLLNETDATPAVCCALALNREKVRLCCGSST